MTITCDECGWPIDLHTRDVRFKLPEEFIDWTPDELATRTEGNDTFLRVDDERFYMRAIVPIHLRGDHLVAFGAWLEIDYDTVERAFGIWDTAEYAGFTCTGQLANLLPPWPALLGTTVTAEVRHLDELPYIVSSSDPTMQHVLDAAWNHSLVLDSIAAV